MNHMPVEPSPMLLERAAVSLACIFHLSSSLSNVYKINHMHQSHACIVFMSFQINIKRFLRRPTSTNWGWHFFQGISLLLPPSIPHFAAKMVAKVKVEIHQCSGHSKHSINMYWHRIIEHVIIIGSSVDDHNVGDFQKVSSWKKKNGLFVVVSSKNIPPPKEVVQVQGETQPRWWWTQRSMNR